MPEIIVGRVRPNWRGSWDPVIPYQTLDVVTYGGASFAARGPLDPGIVPVEGPFWALVAAKGDKGDIGPQGIQGPRGPAGDGAFLYEGDEWDALAKRITNVLAPVESGDAATKAYVDAVITIAQNAVAAANAANALAAGKVSKTGDTINGSLVVTGAVQVPTGSGLSPALRFGGGTLTDGLSYETGYGLRMIENNVAAAEILVNDTALPSPKTVVKRAGGDARYAGIGGVAGSFGIKGSGTIEGNAFVHGGALVVFAAAAGSSSVMQLRNHTGGTTRGAIYAHDDGGLVRLVKYGAAAAQQTHLSLYSDDIRMDGVSIGAGVPSTASLLNVARGDARYLQPGNVFTQAQSEARYVRSVRLAGGGTFTPGDNSVENAPAGAVLTGARNNQASNSRNMFAYKYLQALINGSWATIASV